MLTALNVLYSILYKAGARQFYLLRSVQTDPETHSASYSMGTGGSFLEVKQPRREADILPPSSAEIKMAELYHHSPIRIMAWCLIT
jgi:hypothetical protein